MLDLSFDLDAKVTMWRTKKGSDTKIMKFQCGQSPSSATHYSISEFLTCEKVWKLDPHLNRRMEVVQETFHCPKCNDVKDYVPGHGDGYECGKCGLKYQVFGAGIYVWM